MTKPYNVLFIITDQQRADHNGFMGNRILRTPNLDAIAASGMTFDNAWVSNPVCMPNRATIMTGRMPSAHGVIFNDRSLDWNANTFVRRFRSSGYRAGLLGKSHLQHGMSKNSILPFRGESSGKAPYPDGWDQWEDFDRYQDKNFKDPEDFYGFDHIELSIDHGARMSGHHLIWALEKGGNYEELVIDLDGEMPGSRQSEQWRQIYRPPYDAELHSTSFVSERTIAFIQDAESENKPWLAWCSFPDPHHPMTPPGKWFDLYDPADIELPGSRLDKLESAPEHLKVFANIHPRDQRNWVAPCGYGSDALLREAIATTYGMIAMIDDGVGQILEYLEENNIRDNTIIVFTSDHGDMMGDHSLFLKGFMHYRGTLQVPLVIDMPGLSPGRTCSMASSIDLGPTLMDLCGITDYDGIQGKSLRPIMENSTTHVRDHILIEDDVPLITAKLTPIPARTRTLLMDEFKFSRNSKGEEQLFDLEKDTDEMSNIVDRPNLRSRMLTTLNDAMMLADDSSRGAPSTH